MMKLISALILLLALAACGQESPAEPAQPSSPPPGRTPPAADQRAQYLALLDWEKQAAKQTDAWMREWQRLRAADPLGRLPQKDARELGRRIQAVYGSLGKLNISDAEVAAIRGNMQQIARIYAETGGYVALPPAARGRDLQQKIGRIAVLAQENESLKHRLNRKFGIRP